MNEFGYSLMEVMVAIVILAVAIIPMVGMFDMGLKSATLGGNYDKARALANAKVEEARTLPFRKDGGAVDSLLERYRPVNDPPTTSGGLGPGAPVPCDQGIFDCEVTTRYVRQDLATAASGVRTSWIKVEVQVRWDSGAKSYKTTGLKVR